jgi:hypothetical protein
MVDRLRMVVSQQAVVKSFCGNRNANHHLGTDFFVRKGIISVVKGVEFVQF